MMDTAALTNPGLRRQRKVTDIPAAITDRDIIQKYRSLPDNAELRRGSLNLQKPKPPGKDDLSRRKSTASAPMDVMKIIKKTPSVAAGKTTKTPSQVSSKTSTSSSSPSSVNKKRSISDTVERNISDTVGQYTLNTPSSQATLSSLSNRSNDSSMRHVSSSSQLLQLKSNPMLPNREPSYDIDLSYLQPFGSLGLFSTTGVTGSKARLSTSEGLRKYGSLQDLSGIHDNRSSRNLYGFSLRRSSSTTHILDDIRAVLRAPVNVQIDTSKLTVKERHINNRTQNVSATRNDRPENKSASNNLSAFKTSAKKSPLTRSGKPSTGTKQVVNNRSSKTSAQKKKKSDKVPETRQVESKPTRRVIITQTTEDGLDEFEVVGFI